MYFNDTIAENMTKSS